MPMSRRLSAVAAGCCQQDMRVLGAAAAARLCAPAAAIARSRGLVRGDRRLAKELLCATQCAALWQSRPATWLTVSPGTAHGGGRRLVTSAAQQASEDEAMRYEMKTQVEHVLHRPDVYVGSMETTERQMLVYNVKTRQAEFRPVKYVPGLLKLFDEIIVNAADNKIRDPSMDRIEVTIDEKRNVISVWNNGKGIPVIRHAQYEGIYIPELVMGNLLAGSNFDDSEKRLGGGRHGYGAKLTNIFSNAFTVETGDSVRQLLYRQTWRDNMSVREPAALTPLAAGTMDYTRVTFSVDIARFSKQAKKLDKDIVALWARRVLDVAGCNPGIKCFLNGRLVKVSSQLARTLFPLLTHEERVDAPRKHVMRQYPYPSAG